MNTYRLFYLSTLTIGRVFILFKQVIREGLQHSFLNMEIPILLLWHAMECRAQFHRKNDDATKFEPEEEQNDDERADKLVHDPQAVFQLVLIKIRFPKKHDWDSSQGHDDSGPIMVRIYYYMHIWISRMHQYYLFVVSSYFIKNILYEDFCAQGLFVFLIKFSLLQKVTDGKWGRARTTPAKIFGLFYTVLCGLKIVLPEQKCIYIAVAPTLCFFFSDKKQMRQIYSWVFAVTFILSSWSC